MKISSVLNQKIVQKMVERRGYVHAFDTLIVSKTALVVIDMSVDHVYQDPQCQPIIAHVNRLSDAIRKKHGQVAWVTSASHKNQRHLDCLMGPKQSAQLISAAENMHCKTAQNGLHPDLVVHADDMFAMKDGFSAFFPGKCDLHDQLLDKNITHLLIAGTVTNVCCESSARDAVELGYKITMIADANAGHSHGLHEASLNTIYRIFGDVRDCDDVLSLIEAQ